VKAVVMAGGEGSRLRPLTINRPKPMVPIVDRQVMWHIIELLKIHGITEIVVTVQYLANVIQDHFGDGSAYGVHIEYCLEDQPLGTTRSRCARLLMPSLVKILCRWYSTVRGLMNRRAPISALERPSRANCAICVS